MLTNIEANLKPVAGPTASLHFYFEKNKEGELVQKQSRHEMAARDAMNGDWQSQCSSNVVRARHLLENGLYTDCEFLVGGEYQKQVKRLSHLP